VDPRGRGALAGALAAAAWAAWSPVTRRAFGTPYSDVRLLGGGPLGLALHNANGAGFGFLFVRVGGRGAAEGILAAVAENAVLWPGMALVDRFHPRRRDGSWPPLARNPRVFAQATLDHALFGALLGALAGRR
jgi:hypothetical protein